MKSINQSKHIQLLQAELDFQTFEFEKLLSKQAAKMFVDKQLYICRYQGYDEARGNIILRFDTSICPAPRKNENLHCFISTFQDHNVKQWGAITYKDLRSECLSQFEAKTVFFNYEKDHTIVGLSGIKEHEVSIFERNALVFLGPTDPPLQYLINLVEFVKMTKQENNPYLNISLYNPSWNPISLTSNNPVLDIQTALVEFDTVIIQGPPGTGKTYLMAQICDALLRTNYRIMVTALTNRALIELAEKEHLKSALNKGLVYKTSLTADEQKNKKIKGIKPLKNLKEQQPPLLLSTYYVMSQIATKAMEEEHFDYIVIEEASQAFLATIALARKLGKKCIIIGDVSQLEPIIQKEYSIGDPNNYHWMVCGLKSLSYYYKNSKNYILTDSYRLTENAVNATNVFYEDRLKSKSAEVLPIPFRMNSIANKLLNSNGGTTIEKITMDNGVLPSNECIHLIIKLINEVFEINPKSEIAVLAFNRETVRILQSQVLQNFKSNDTILIETIDRIQGMTVDYCFFVIPQGSIPFSIHPNRFNVATSRARLCTLIIADKQIDHFIALDDKIKTFFNRI
jgi:Ni2+-binding GTPase involved in maturation of urease and hydrogenase